MALELSSSGALCSMYLFSTDALQFSASTYRSLRCFYIEQIPRWCKHDYQVNYRKYGKKNIVQNSKNFKSVESNVNLDKHFNSLACQSLHS